MGSYCNRLAGSSDLNFDRKVRMKEREKYYKDWNNGIKCQIRVLPIYNKHWIINPINSILDYGNYFGSRGITVYPKSCVIEKFPNWIHYMFEGIKQSKTLKVAQIYQHDNNMKLTAIINDKKLISNTNEHLNTIVLYIDQLIYIPTDLKKIIFMYLVFDIKLFQIDWS